jgi:hypothetical protein
MVLVSTLLVLRPPTSGRISVKVVAIENGEGRERKRISVGTTRTRW